MPDTLAAGREAIERNDWDAARQALVTAESEDGLQPDDLMLLGDACWWTGHADEAVEAFERAYAGYVREDRRVEAATVGALLAYYASRRLAFSVAAGWIARIEEILDGQPESVGHAWLQILYLATALLAEGDVDKALQLSDRTIELGRTHASPAVHGLGLSFKGVILIQRGEWRQGMALIDEATMIAMAEDCDLRAASDVYCNTIAACRNLADYKRAGEWTEQAERWMKLHSVGGYTGICQVHRAELKRLRGSWTEAEQEARRACGELERFRLMDGLGFAHYEIGEVRRRMGDLTAAEESFMTAYEYGHPAQPGLSLLMLDRGDIEGAAKSISQAVGHSTDIEDSGGRALLSTGRLMPAQVEIALAADDPETARWALGELDRVADVYPGQTWEAGALSCRGSLQLYEDQPEKAIDSLSRAWRLWQEIELPYESAQARLMLGRARLAVGDEMAARLELRAARSAFEKLGAITDLRRVEELLGEGAAGVESGWARETKAFMFTDIVTSTDLIGLIGDSAWENLLKWHDRTLREMFARHHGDEVRHTGDGFFVAFNDARASVECAVAIQRKLREHRREHGFAPWVRIGLHRAEVTKKGRDYAGGGVHAAARVGDLGEREEIIVSASVVEATGSIPYAISEARAVELKGIDKPIEVHTVDWR